MRLAPTAALVALACLAPLHAGTAQAALSYAERVHETILPNGLKVVLLEDHKAPVAVFQIWYRVGSRNEVTGLTGLSHLLEHMMFKGTQKVAPEEYSRIVQRNGGQTNAFTSQDYTTYFATMANNRLGVMIELESDRMTNLVLTDALYGPERDVVKEERRLRTDNDPVSALHELLGSTAYVAHPYQFPVIGWMSDLERSTVDDLRNHYRLYYAPNNAFIVVAGDFDSGALSRDIERAFGSINPGPMPPPVRSIEPLQQGERRVELRREAQLPYIALAYHVPNSQSADGAALEVLAQVLSGGKSTRLYRQLVYRRRLCRDVQASYDLLSLDPGLFTLGAQPLPGKTPAQVERALRAEIERIQDEPPSAREIQKAKNAIEAQFIFAQDSLFYQGLLLGQYEINGDWRRIDEYLPAIRRVTAEDLTRVARFYLRRENQTAATLVPTGQMSRPAGPAGPPRGAVH